MRRTDKQALVCAVLCMVFALFLGCANWEKTTANVLTMTREATTQAATIVKPHYVKKCEGIARDVCKGEPCKELKECQKERDTINKILAGIQFAIADAWMCLAIKDVKATNQRVAKAVKLLLEIKSQLSKLGVFP